MNFLLILKAAKMTNNLSPLFSEYFQHFSKNLKDNYMLLSLLFIKDIGNLKFSEAENELFSQNIENGEENVKSNINMNVSNISLKMSPDESFLSERDLSKTSMSLKIKNRFENGSLIDIKKTLNFDEAVLECLLNFFKIILAYSGSFLRQLFFCILIIFLFFQKTDHYSNDNQRSLCFKSQ